MKYILPDPDGSFFICKNVQHLSRDSYPLRTCKPPVRVDRAEVDITPESADPAYPR